MESKTGQKESKVEEICKQLRALAQEKGPGAQLPPVRTLCQRLSTTRVTLREALTLLEAEQIIYTRERQGVFVSPRINQKIIHVIFSSDFFIISGSPSWSMLWMQMEQEAHIRTSLKNEIYTFHMVKPTDDRMYSVPEHMEKMLQTERVDGVLAVGFQTQEKGELSKGHFPCVSFAGAGLCTIYLDTFEFARLATEALLRQNCQRLGWWTYQFPAYPLEIMSEVQAFRQLLHQHQMPLYPELIRTLHLPPSQTLLSFQEQGYLLAREVFEGPVETRPDGLIIADDMMTDGALVAFEELGIQIGRDVQVVTQANVGSPMLFGRTKRMAVVEYDPALIARTMFAALDMLLAGQTPDKSLTSIPPRLRQ